MDREASYILQVVMISLQSLFIVYSIVGNKILKAILAMQHKKNPDDSCAVQIAALVKYNETLKKENTQFKIDNDWMKENQRIAKVGGWEWELTGDDANKVCLDIEARKIFNIPEGIETTAPMLVSKTYDGDLLPIALVINKAMEVKENYSIYYRNILPSGLIWIYSKGELVFDKEEVPNAPEKLVTHIRGIVQNVGIANETDEFYVGK